MLFFGRVKSFAKKFTVVRKTAAFGRRILGIRPPAPSIASFRTDLTVLRYISAARHTPEVAVVIPVYNQTALLRKCAESLLAFTPADVELCFIDDRSPEPEVAAFLRELAERAPGRVTVLTNDRNLGFSETCNRGMEYAGRRDVVLLNSDAAVSPRWLDELRLAAYEDEHTGTVSAVSNNSGFASVPVPPEAGPLPKDDGSQKIVPPPELLAQVGRAYLHQPEVFFDSPTGHGFCMYLKRAMLDEVGKLDAETFGKGYGEEVDLCMRAYRLGWTHRVTSRVFVWHYNAAAFGDTKRERIKKSNAILAQRYPEFEFRKELMKSIWNKKREALAGMADMFRPGNPPPRPRILFVLGVKSGGTFWTNRDLMRQIRDKYEPFLLFCNGRELRLYDFDDPRIEDGELIAKYNLRNQFSYFDVQSDEMDRVILYWILRCGVELIHIRHMGHISSGFLKTAHRLNIPILLSFHDFFTISPTVKLMDCKNRFHPEGIQDGVTRPDAVVLSKEINVPPPGINEATATHWKESFAQKVFPYCRFFITTCEDARSRLMAHFPTLAERADDFFVIPHGRDIDPRVCGEKAIDFDAPIKLLYLGNCTAAKGGDLLARVMQADRGHRLKLHLVGAVQPELQDDMNALRRTGRVVLHGSYDRGGEAAIVQKIRPHIAVIPSLWPETWCHTLTECWALGIPVITFDIGALGERMRSIGGGWLLPPDCSPEKLLREIVRIADDPDEYAEKREAVLRWQEGFGRSNTTEKMASRYQELYADALLPAERSAAKP